MTKCVLLLALTVMSSTVPMFRAAAELRPFSPFKILHLQVQRANVTNVHSVKYERGCACGKANKIASGGEDSDDDDDGKIVGGTDAAENEFPWQAVVYSPTSGGFCGGTIINQGGNSIDISCCPRTCPKS